MACTEAGVCGASVIIPVGVVFGSGLARAQTRLPSLVARIVAA